MPGLSDLIAGVYHDRSISLRDDPIFRFNPDIAFTDTEPKSILSRALDIALKAVLKIPALRRRYERWVFRRTEALFKSKGQHFVHIDMQAHSYASHQTKQKTFWKPGRAEEAMAKPFNISHVKPEPQLTFQDSEIKNASTILEQHNIRSPFIAVEPDTNRDWFGDLRAWPMSRWQDVCDKLSKQYPNITIVQIGMGRGGLLNDVIDLTNKTDFRTVSIIIKEAALFMGTEGGLMHAAKAVNAPAVILWGGITIPEFIGYPDDQVTLCKHVDCAPCGNAGWCDQGHKCMLQITPAEVIHAATSLLDKRKGT
ncbi:MAG: hypothetical protein OQK24_01305 [Magnetovibrio sp.]|nr:hypothetical protein [Magnetovibrio sp.]